MTRLEAVRTARRCLQDTPLTEAPHRLEAGTDIRPVQFLLGRSTCDVAGR